MSKKIKFGRKMVQFWRNKEISPPSFLIAVPWRRGHVFAEKKRYEQNHWVVWVLIGDVALNVMSDLDLRSGLAAYRVACRVAGGLMV